MNAPQARQYIGLAKLGWLYDGTDKDGAVTLVREVPGEWDKDADEKYGACKPALQRIRCDRNGFSRQSGVQ